MRLPRLAVIPDPAMGLTSLIGWLVGLGGCALVIGDGAEPLTGRWQTIEASAADHRLDLALVETADGRLTGSGSVHVPGARFDFAIDSGLATSTRARFRLVEGGTPLGRFEGTIVNRSEIVGRTTLDVLQDGFAVRLARAPEDSTATGGDVGFRRGIAH